MTLADMNVTDAGSGGADMSGGFKIDANTILRYGAEEDGSGGIQNEYVTINGDLTVTGEISGTSADYGEMGNITDADEVLASADQWYGMYAAEITGSSPHLNSGFTFQAGSNGVIASSDTGAGSSVTFTDAAHGLLAGDFITLNGMSDASYNGVYEVQSVTTDTFTITETNTTASETGFWQMGSYLEVPTAGVYRGAWNASFSQSDNATRISIVTPFINTTQSTKAVATRAIDNNTDVGSIGGNGLMSFSAGDRIWFACQSNDPQTLTFTIRNITIH